MCYDGSHTLKKRGKCNMRALTVYVTLFGVLTLSGLNAACRMERDPIEMTMAKQLEDVEVGMTKDEFQRALPKAYRKGQKLIGGMTVEAYEVKDSQLVGVLYVWFPEDEYLWFYFYNDRLVKWGQPGSWPEPPDLIVESRNR